MPLLSNVTNACTVQQDDACPPGVHEIEAESSPFDMNRHTFDKDRLVYTGQHIVIPLCSRFLMQQIRDMAYRGLCRLIGA
jgi:hypothetical protein